MTPHGLEDWYESHGRPAWYWPTVIAALFVGAPLLVELIERMLP